MVRALLWNLAFSLTHSLPRGEIELREMNWFARDHVQPEAGSAWLLTSSRLLTACHVATETFLQDGALVAQLQSAAGQPFSALE